MAVAAGRPQQAAAAVSGSGSSALRLSPTTGQQMEPLNILTFNIRGKDVRHWAQPDFTRKDKFKRIAELCSAPSPHPARFESGGTFIYVENGPVDATGLGAVGPVALARIRQLRLCDNSAVEEVFLAACHLLHGHMEGGTRRDQLEAALKALPPRSLVVVAGDTNLRGDIEDFLGECCRPISSYPGWLTPYCTVLLCTGPAMAISIPQHAWHAAAEHRWLQCSCLLAVAELGLEDAFLQLGCPIECRYTWDPFNNRYHGPSE